MGRVIDVWDVVVALGASCVVAGVWWAWPPGGLALLGACLVGVGALGAKKWVS